MFGGSGGLWGDTSSLIEGEGHGRKSFSPVLMWMSEDKMLRGVSAVRQQVKG